MSDIRNEIIRQIVDKAVACGRHLQSDQSGYLHYFYGSLQNEEPFLTIPFVENALFALALLRSHTAENGLEAKVLLTRLLHFQNDEGNFPIYLHEYPEGRNRLTCAHAAVPFFWILKNYPTILGNELKKKMENALLKAVAFSLKTMQEQDLPYPLMLKIASLASATGTLFNDKVIQSAGEVQLAEMLSKGNVSAWYSPSQMGTILSSLQMVYSRIDASPWHLFWKHLTKTWHQKACTYIGPSIKEYQEGFEPQVTLYDLYLSYFSGKYSSRIFKEHISHLEGGVIQSSEEMLTSPSYPYSEQGSISEKAQWSLVNRETFGYSYVEKGALFSPSLEKGFHLFRFVRGTSARTHTLVCQGGNFGKTALKEAPDSIELSFYLDEPVNSEEREKNRDITFYFDFDEESEVMVAGSKATTFALEDEIAIKAKDFSFCMRFSLEEGEGRFLGHLMRGNRPSQVNLKGSQRFHAYDWQLFLRSIQRPRTSTIKLRLSWSF